MIYISFCPIQALFLREGALQLLPLQRLAQEQPNDMKTAAQDTGEVWVLLYRHGTSAGPWHHQRFRDVCQFNDVFDVRLHRLAGVVDVLESRRVLRVYIDCNSLSRTPMTKIRNGADYKSGRKLFKFIFDKIICPQMAYTSIHQRFWTWLSDTRRRNSLAIYKYANNRISQLDLTRIEWRDEDEFIKIVRRDLLYDSDTSFTPGATNFLNALHYLMCKKELDIITKTRKKLLGMLYDFESIRAGEN